MLERQPVRSWKDLRSRWCLIVSILRGESVIYRVRFHGYTEIETTASRQCHSCLIDSVTSSGCTFNGEVNHD